MATLTEHKPGDFCWMELGTSDQEAAKTFYGDLLGWTAQDNLMGPTEVYNMFQLGGRATGGRYRAGQGSQMPEIPPHWDLYIAVSNAVETAAAITVKDENGAFCRADLSTPDPAKAKEFYEKVFGWSIEGGQEAENLPIKNGEVFIGGIQALAHRKPNAPPQGAVFALYQPVHAS